MTTKLPVRDKALSLLARCDRTEHQIKASLARSGYGDAEIGDAVDFLLEYGYLDDASYAEKYLRILVAKSRGRRRIAEEMRRHGLSREVIEAALENGYPEETESELALALAEKVALALPADMPRRDVARRISQKLAGRGYGYDIINGAVDRVTMSDDS